ncbi:MAG: heparinase II/III domain-containing protein [Microbacterium sp.]
MSYSSSMAKDLAFGVPWNPLSTDKASAQKLSRGVLALPPHPDWTMPETLNWSANPFGEINWVAQFHMLRWLDPLRRQAEKGEVGHLDTWVHVAHSWIEDNPPGRGKASYSWGDMVEAARAVTFCLALPILEAHRPEAVPRVLESIREHGEWLADESHIRTGNHALQQHQGLLVIGAVLEEDEWTDLAIDRSRAMLRSSYDAQGINEEGAVQYHQINYSWWNTLARRVRVVRGEVPPEFELVQKAPVAMAHATRPDGNYELIGDTEVFSSRGVGHPATDYIASDGERGAAPRERCAVYDGGYVFGRSTWGDSMTRFSEADFFSLRFGRQNRIHGHTDGMALTLFHNGESLLVDSGKYAYDAKDPYRAHFLSRESHNSVSIDGVEYDRTSIVELTHRHIGDDCSHFRFEDTGYSGVVLTRDVLLCLPEQLIVVIDSFRSEAPVAARQHWHLNPEAGHRKEGDSVFTVTPESQMRLAFAGHGRTTIVQGATEPIQGWYSPTWRKKVGNRTITAEASGSTGRILTALSYGTAPEHLSIDHRESTEDGIEVFSISRDDAIHTACLGPDWGHLASGDRSGLDVRRVIDDERH